MHAGQNKEVSINFRRLEIGGADDANSSAKASLSLADSLLLVFHIFQSSWSSEKAYIENAPINWANETNEERFIQCHQLYSLATTRSCLLDTPNSAQLGNIEHEAID